MSNVFTANIRSNWCQAGSHFHRSGHANFAQTGKVRVSPFLSGTEVVKLPEEVIRFHRLLFNIGCCCCRNQNAIGAVSVVLSGRRCRSDTATVQYSSVSTYNALEAMFDEFHAVLRNVLDQNGFERFKASKILAKSHF